MNAAALLNYRFANAAQWAAGALVGGSAGDGGIVPLLRLDETAR